MTTLTMSAGMLAFVGPLQLSGLAEFTYVEVTNVSRNIVSVT